MKKKIVKVNDENIDHEFVALFIVKLLFVLAILNLTCSPGFLQRLGFFLHLLKIYSVHQLGYLREQITQINTRFHNFKLRLVTKSPFSSIELLCTISNKSPVRVVRPPATRGFSRSLALILTRD